MIFRPSAAHRWMACPGSLGRCEIVPRRPPGPWTLEGTAAHYLAAKKFRKPTYKWPANVWVEFVDGQVLSVEVTREMEACVDFYLRTVKNQANGRWGIEHPFNIDLRETRIQGTIDHARQVGLEHWIDDLKYGQGVKVSAEWNFQLMIYAIGYADNQLKGRVFHLRIVQPRMNHVSTWTISGQDLAEWRDKTLIPAIEEAKNSDRLMPGEHCQFCDALIYCPAYEDLFLGIDLDSKEPPALNLGILKFKKQIAKYLDEMEKEAISRLMKGVPVPGFKLVQGPGRSSWKVPEEEVQMALYQYVLAEDFYTQKFATPAQIKKISSAPKETLEKIYKDLVEIKHGIILAPEDDRRKAWSGSDSVEEVFGDVD